jgi:hypothetical protein
MEAKMDKIIGLLRTHGVNFGEKMDISELQEELICAVSQIVPLIPSSMINKKKKSKFND